MLVRLHFMAGRAKWTRKIDLTSQTTIIIITSNDDPKPSTVISERPPTGLIPRHIKSQPGLQSASQVTYITGKWVSWLVTGF